MYRTLLLVSFGLAAVPAQSADANLEKLRADIAKALPSITINDVRPSPVPGIFEVSANNQLVYVTADGKYLFTGDLIDVSARVNLSEKQREKGILAAVNKLGDSKMIVIGPKTPKHVVTVFTDVDCPYCSKLHLEVPALVKGGVQVRYIFFPRAGLGSQSFNRSVAVWCAKDRAEAIGVAKAGGKLDMKTCDNPVTEHHQLAQTLGIQGTPAIVLDSGTMVPGYLPAPKLLAMLEAQGKK